MFIIKAVLILFRNPFMNRNDLLLENLALRQQLAVQQQTIKRPKLRNLDRWFWLWLSRFWSQWKSALIIVKPETVIKWHRQGFRIYWRRKSKTNRVGRPRIPQEIRDLIRRMCQENATWGAPRIQSELSLLGYSIAESTVSQYMIKSPKPPSQTWRTFLKNHVDQIAAIDFFTVPTVTFRILYCFIVLHHGRRQIVHFNITTNPTTQWTAQQITEAFPYEETPKYMIRDRDTIYSQFFRKRVKNFGIKEVVISPQSPWQNPYCERVIGSIRRECLDHMIILNENHLVGILDSYFEYYHNSRTHLSLDRNSPIPRDIEPQIKGKVIAIPQVGGLHHRYSRVA